jgi:hypothetical protein
MDVSSLVKDALRDKLNAENERNNLINKSEKGAKKGVNAVIAVLDELKVHFPNLKHDVTEREKSSVYCINILSGDFLTSISVWGPYNDRGAIQMGIPNNADDMSECYCIHGFGQYYGMKVEAFTKTLITYLVKSNKNIQLS